MGVAVMVALIGMAVVEAQIAIPSHPFGYPQGSSDAPVVLEVFVDLLCPDSADSWDTLKQVFAYYGPEKLRFVTHLFTLPLIHNSFFANQGARVVEKYANESAFWSYVDLIFLNQEQFWSAPTQNLTANQVIDLLASTTETAGIMPKSDFLEGFSDPYTASEAFNSWKYACSRVIGDTPTFFVNGAQVAADSSWTLKMWQQILNPLFSTQKPCSNGTRTIPKGDQCPSGETSCEYLPGQYECCLPGEYCIKNVGCSC